MKNIVVFDEYTAIDLKPSSLITKYIELTKEDIARLLVNKQELTSCGCPACQSKAIESPFTKFGLQYNECRECRSLYISPRPADDVLNRYYHEAKARIFWREELSKRTSQKRKEKILRPRFQWILDSTQEYRPEAKSYADVNTSQYDYAETMAQAAVFKRKILIDPFFDSLLKPPPGGVQILDRSWWQASFHEELDVLSLFEVLDRISDADQLLMAVNKMLKKGGLIFITAILASGFDVQVLWEKADNLYPPDRLNVFSLEGLKILFVRHGFECLELSTPGILDVDIVAKAVEKDMDLKISRFTRNLLERGEETRNSFQEFLQQNLLSSYARVVLRKK